MIKKPPIPPDSRPWYAVQVRSGWERSAGQALECKGIEVFVPVYGLRHRWCDRWKWVEQPLLPGYLFCRCAPAERIPILKTPGVTQIVGCGRAPVPVEEREIESIREILASELPVSPWPFCRVGDRVQLAGGPLRGLEGILLEVGDAKRLIVSVSLLQRSVAVEIDESWAVPREVKAHAAQGLRGTPEVQAGR